MKKSPAFLTIKIKIKGNLTRSISYRFKRKYMFYCFKFSGYQTKKN